MTAPDLEEMVIYNFSNLDSQKDGMSNCFSCDISEAGGCDSCDFCDHGGW